MQLLITFLTALLVLNCLLLILLVLIQLPKKEAGAGLAFGGGTTDALFGAGSGNALTKLTKYSAGTFLLMSVVLGVMNVRLYHSGDSEVRRALARQKAAATTPATTPVATTPAAGPFTKLDPSGGTNSAFLTTVPTTTANAGAVAATNAAPVTTNAPRAATNTTAPK